MPAAQSLLFPDPQPLVERLGRDFFRQLPEHPGIYLMRDREGSLLYVGKAKNLKKRLGTYRVANPDRMPRRHLRLLRAVTHIEIQLCPDETSALAKEAELLRTLRPPYNRAGTWVGIPQFLSLRCSGQNLCLTVTADRPAQWRTLGPMGRGAFLLRGLLARLLWLGLDPIGGFSSMPAGWVHYHFEPETVIRCGEFVDLTERLLRELFSGDSHPFCQWVQDQVSEPLHPFHRQALAEDLESLEDLMPRSRNLHFFPPSSLANLSTDGALTAPAPVPAVPPHLPGF